MADTTTELEVLDQIVDVLGGQSGQYETVVPVLQQIKELLAAGITDPEAIAEAVTAWLDEHPEATTTVRDGSITVMKLAQDVIELLDSKADIDGYYSQLTAGLAENLICRGDAVPAEYLYRTAGGDADIEDGIATIDCIKGQTIVWNQLVVNGNFASMDSIDIIYGTGMVADNVLTATANSDTVPILRYTSQLVSAHKCLIRIDVKPSEAMSGLSIYPAGIIVNNLTGGEWNTISRIATIPSDISNKSVYFNYNNVNSGKSTQFRNFCIFDLTLMFGAGNEPATVEEFEAMFPLPYYPYSTPKLLSVDIRGVETVGFNLWDEEWEVGGLSSNGANETANNRIRSKNYTNVFPSTAYFFNIGNVPSITDTAAGARICFYDAGKTFISQTIIYKSWGSSTWLLTTPSNCRYVRFHIGGIANSAYTGGFCLNLSWSGYRNGEYEEHWLAERPIDTSRFFPTGMKKVGDKADALYADHYDTVIGAVDLGTLTWNLQIGSTQNYFRSNTYDWLVAGVNNVVADVKCAKYEAAAPNNIADKTINVSTKNRLVIRDDSFNDDVSAFAASLNGVMLYYELAAPTTTEIDPPLNLSYKVSDFGTERIMVDETADAPQTAPVPMEVEYGINAIDTIRRLPEEYQSHKSMGQLTAALESSLGIDITETWDEDDQRYEYEISDFELADGSIPDAKLAQTGGVLSKVAGIDGFLFTKVPNLFDPANVIEGLRTVSSGSKLQYYTTGVVPRPEYKTVRVAVQPNTAYTVVRSGSTYGVCSTSPTYIDAAFMTTAGNNPYDVTPAKSFTSTDTFINFTTDANAQYLYLCYTITGEDATIAIYEGTYSDFQPESMPNVYTKAQIDSGIAGTVYRVGNYTIITNGAATYTLRHIVNAQINVDCYRIYDCTLTDSGDVVWSGSDADGVVKLVGESDFIGGLHGDEATTAMHMLIDGVEVASGDFSKVDYSKLVIYCESTVYHCDTTTPAFTRYKVLTFDADGVRIQNRWVAAETVSVHLCYFGMLSVLRLCSDGTTPLINGYSVSPILELMGNTETTAIAEGNDEAVMHTRYGDMSIKYNGPADTANYGSVENYTTPDQRLKVYMGTVWTNGAGKTFTAGEALMGDYRIRI